MITLPHKHLSNIKNNRTSMPYRPSRMPIKSMKAFTLIEMMVSVSIFLIVMVIILGALLAIIDGNKKVQAINSVANNLNSAIESMVRDIKTGYKYKCPTSKRVVVDGTGPSDCLNPTSPVDNLAFISTISGIPRSVQYWRETDTITGRSGIMKNFCPSNVASPATLCKQEGSFKSLFITSPDIDITKLEFYVKVPDAGDDQPGVFIVIKGTAFINKNQSSDFSIQTFVSQRLLNI